MAKDLSRKAPRRARRPTPIDDDLAELAGVLSEYALDNTAYGWFRPPWRDGAHAVDLACSAAMTLSSASAYPDMANAREVLSLTSSTTHMNSSLAYEQAGRLYNGLIQPKINTDPIRFLATALRCFQLKIANSHGGGIAYNEILIAAFLPIEPALVERLVLEYRCRDAIGTTSHLQGDKHDRERSAFSIAWKRGLYFAAYSIRPPGSEIK
jgi:hypothetical protein